MAENKTVNIMFYNKKYDRKPQGKEIGTIQNHLSQTTISIRELADNMASGHTFKCAYLNGTKNTDFVSQQLFGLDFDHGITIDEALHKCETLGIMPVFGYTTFSHTPENHRFRLIFCNNKVIYDARERRKIQLSLMKAFGFADPACKDETRMFFGGRSLIMFNEDNVINGSEIIQKYYSDDLETNAKYKPKSKTINNKSKNKSTPINQDTVNQTEIYEKVRAISELNVDEMKRLLKKYDRTKQIDKPNKPDLSGKRIEPCLHIKKTKHISPSLKIEKSSNIIKTGLDINAAAKPIRAGIDIVKSKPIKAGLEIKESKHIQPFLSSNEKDIDNGLNAFDDFDLDIKDLDSIAVHIAVEIIRIALKYCLREKINSAAGVLVGGDNIDHLSITPYKNPPDENNNNNKIFKCKNDLYNYINSLDLGEYLGIYNSMVNCILPEHEDNTPSAHVYVNENGVEFYKCFGCGKARSIIGITEHLAGCKRHEAIEFIKNVYNLELVESEWTQQHKALMLECASFLDSDEFKTEFPELNKVIRTRKHHIKMLLLHFSEKINEDMMFGDKPIFFGSYPQLMEVCNIRKSDNLAQSLSLFALLNLLEKLPEGKIPENELKKAKAIAAQYGLKKITNFYSFSEYGVDTFTESEENAKKLKENNVTLKGLSRELVLRTFGEETANRIYPQFVFENSRGTSEKSDDHTAEIVSCIQYCINKKGYCTETDIVKMLNDKHHHVTTEVQIKKSLQEILTSYGLKRVRANKDIKEKYNITGNGYPFIIVNE